MARQSRATTTVPYFKFDAGQFLAETRGLSGYAIGLYSLAQALYWEAGCSLPDPVVLERQLGVRTAEERGELEVILSTFFEDGRHERLDGCLAEVRDTSRRQSEIARRRYTKPEPKPEPGEELSADQF